MANTSAVLLKKKRLEQKKKDEAAEKLRKRQMKILKARKDAGEITPEEKDLKRELRSTYKGSTYKQDEGGKSGLGVLLAIAAAVVIGIIVLIVLGVS